MQLIIKLVGTSPPNGVPYQEEERCLEHWSRGRYREGVKVLKCLASMYVKIILMSFKNFVVAVISLQSHGRTFKFKNHLIQLDPKLFSIFRYVYQHGAWLAHVFTVLEKYATSHVILGLINYF